MAGLSTGSGDTTLASRARCPLVLAALGPLEQEAVHQPPGEAHPHADARLGRCVEVGGHGVVEGPVEVRQRDVDGDAGDGRQVGERWRLGARAARGATTRPREQGELLAATVGNARRHTPHLSRQTVTTARRPPAPLPPIGRAQAATTFRAADGSQGVQA